MVKCVNCPTLFIYGIVSERHILALGIPLMKEPTDGGTGVKIIMIEIYQFPSK